jgi:UDP-N-acetylmuramate dehydrogenase
MLIEEHKSLKTFNTFGIDCKARYFISVTNLDELKEVVQIYGNTPLFILGGGSNMLLTQDLDQLVIHMGMKGIERGRETAEYCEVKVAGGENWHEFVTYCLDNNLGGVENLALIPGNVGTAPIQNIGAYGVELVDTFVSCEAIEIGTAKTKVFYGGDCKFGYRDSVFKNELKGKFIIFSVTFRLSKTNHQLHTGYGAIQSELDRLGVDQGSVSIRDVANAVINIRRSKLPDPAKLGNSGSFFKNPVIEKAHYSGIQGAHPDIPSYPVSESQVKVPAGWLIEQSGLKGYRSGDAGVHERQALVLVNHGQATGKQIWDLAMEVQSRVKEKFGILLEPEVNVI